MSAIVAVAVALDGAPIWVGIFSIGCIYRSIMTYVETVDPERDASFAYAGFSMVACEVIRKMRSLFSCMLDADILL